MTGLRYLKSRSLTRSELGPCDQRFAALRDEYVIGFRYHTARAYAGDLDHLYRWATGAGLNVMGLTMGDIKRYAADLQSERYTPNTLVRKRTALRGFYSLAAAVAACGESPMGGWAWSGR